MRKVKWGPSGFPCLPWTYFLSLDSNCSSKFWGEASVYLLALLHSPLTPPSSFTPFSFHFLFFVTHCVQLVLPAAMLTDLVGLILCRSCTGDHSYHDFRSTVAMSYPEDNISQPFSPSSGSGSPCIPISRIFPEPRDG